MHPFPAELLVLAKKSKGTSPTDTGVAKQSSMINHESSMVQARVADGVNNGAHSQELHTPASVPSLPRAKPNC